MRQSRPEWSEAPHEAGEGLMAVPAAVWECKLAYEETGRAGGGLCNVLQCPAMILLSQWQSLYLNNKKDRSAFKQGGFLLYFANDAFVVVGEAFDFYSWGWMFYSGNILFSDNISVFD